ncbi:MAG: TetR/AcrR family transcriptional regulator [Candidatus Cloacimonetes bacterium]|nr:TetR/AcrR family transcriptional regulator [Candidatus Cloacimonadota bacterium]MBS3768075.1 TetR/AcrR family transcriptional regulator [Candidatus Cloacimonadota bacterium]
MKSFTKRQKEIINAAIELIAEKGIQHLTIKNLSGKIGIVEGGIYRHFDSKMDILLGILTSFENNIITNIKAPILNDKEKALEKLQTMFEKAIRNFKHKPALAAVIFAEEIFQNDNRLSKKVYKIMHQNQSMIQNIIHAGQLSHTIRTDISDKQLTLIITGTLRLIVTKWRLSDFSYDLENEGKQMWQSIKKLLVK